MRIAVASATFLESGHMVRTLVRTLLFFAATRRSRFPLHRPPNRLVTCRRGRNGGRLNAANPGRRGRMHAAIVPRAGSNGSALLRRASTTAIVAARGAMSTLQPRRERTTPAPIASNASAAASSQAGAFTGTTAGGSL